MRSPSRRLPPPLPLLSSRGAHKRKLSALLSFFYKAPMGGWNAPAASSRAAEARAGVLCASAGPDVRTPVGADAPDAGAGIAADEAKKRSCGVYVAVILASCALCLRTHVPARSDTCCNNVLQRDFFRPSSQPSPTLPTVQTNKHHTRRPEKKKTKNNNNNEEAKKRRGTHTFKAGKEGET